MKYGMRKPSWKKSLSARTKGRATRAVKKALISGYGKKGMGWLHPKRKLYNTIYKKTTFSNPSHPQEHPVQPVRPVQVTGAKGGGESHVFQSRHVRVPTFIRPSSTERRSY